ncbi:MAG: MFS transporter [Chthoniobacterales bacterium]|nr:MFS transporter [Chthoniobacterales bacterium]
MTSLSKSKRSSAKPSTSKGDDSKRGSVRALMTLNFFIADVQNGMGAFVALYLMAGVGWNAAQIGTALAAGSIAQVLAQTPAGALIDQLRQKRALIITGGVMIAIGCLSIALLSTLTVVTAGQALIGVAGAIFPPCLAAIALGLVGRKRMDRQMGTNQAFNAAGNMTAAVVFGVVGYFFGLKWMFYLVVVFVVIAIICVLRIKPGDIDFDLARGADRDGAAPNECVEKPKGVWNGLKDLLVCFGQLFKQQAVLVFLVSAVIFHFANAAMVPLVTELLGKNQGVDKAILFTSGYMVASQFVFIIVAALSGRLASKIGRKPLFLFAFAALAVRGLLYTLSRNPVALIAVQCMDGLGAGIFGVVAVLIIADLTKGTGRFNAAQGAIATAQGTGAFLSNSIAGYVVHHAGANAAFYMLAAIAAVGLIFFWLLMPETKGIAHGNQAAPAAA